MTALSAQQEPCAWRCEKPGKEPYVVWTAAHAQQERDWGYKVAPLYAAPLAQPGGKERDVERWKAIEMRWQSGETILTVNEQGFYTLHCEHAEFANEFHVAESPEAVLDLMLAAAPDPAERGEKNG